MKKSIIALFFLALSASAFARPIVLISSFDAFADFKTNNTETITKILSKINFQDVDLEFCQLETKYDIGFEQLQECYRKLQGKEVAAVISLGEGACEVYLETLAVNHDNNSAKSYAADNAGVKRNQAIIQGAEFFQGFTLPIEKLFCKLDKEELKNSSVSVTKQTFVCNNVAYLFRHNYPDVPYTFVHVPNARCRKIDRLNNVSVSILSKLINLASESYQNKTYSTLPNSMDLIKQKEKESMGCEKSFFNKMKKDFRG